MKDLESFYIFIISVHKVLNYKTDLWLFIFLFIMFPEKQLLKYILLALESLNYVENFSSFTDIYDKIQVLLSL